MSYKFEKNGEITIGGFEQGISDSPYSGIADMRNVNIVSIPEEASAGFSTSSMTPPAISGNVLSANSTDKTVTLDINGFTQSQAVTFAGGSLPAGITAGTVYWLTLQSGTTYFVWTDFALTTKANITATGTGTVATVNMGLPKYFTNLKNPFVNTSFMLDVNGRCWTSMPDFYGVSGVFRYTGNTVDATSMGNGLVSYIPSDTGTSSHGYIFVFRNFSIDYALVTSNNTITWTYGWNPTTGTSGNSNYLKCYGTSSTNYPHESLLGPDNAVYYCDANYIGQFYQRDPSVAFDPTLPSTYVFAQTSVLPFTETAQCLSWLGVNLLIGGTKYIVYVWDTFSQLSSNYIFISENNIVKMTTVNTNTFIFAGNRGRIYITNGAQAQLYKKIPDFITGTVEPYFTWGGVTNLKNQLYFSFSVTTNNGTPITTLGGVWSINISANLSVIGTQTTAGALRMTNKLSYGTYAGLATALLPITSSANPAGAGILIGWDNGASGFGIDTSSGTLYTGGQATIDTDLIPVGTMLEKRTFKQVEYKLSVPLTSGESVQIYWRPNGSSAFTSLGTAITEGGTTLSGYFTVNFQGVQWIQLRIVLNPIPNISTTSFVRLKQIIIR